MQQQKALVGLALLDHCVGVDDASNGSQMNNFDSESCDEERDWSLLPGNIIWGIRDRLDSFENMRVSEVCRSWQSAIKPCSEPQLPWALCDNDGQLPDRSLINVSTKQICTFKMPDLAKHEYISCSKQGWLLLRLLEPKRAANWLFATCLFNPITGVTINLPGLATAGGEKAAISTTSSGVPLFVVLAGYTNKMSMRLITLYIARPGDNDWELHTYESTSPRSDVFVVILCGSTHVYCFDYDGFRIYIFDLSDKSWRTCHVDGWLGYLLESDGEIIYAAPNGLDSFVFSRMQVEEGDNFKWVAMRESELEDRLWFLCFRGSFSVRGRGRKIYHITGPDLFVEEMAVDGTAKSLLPHPLPYGFEGWIDIVGFRVFLIPGRFSMTINVV